MLLIIIIVRVIQKRKQKSVSMFQQNLHKALTSIWQYQQKLQSYRQLLNQQIQFNIKDLYIKISNNSAQVTAYHIHLFLTEDDENQDSYNENEIDLYNQNQNNCVREDAIVELTEIQSVIKSYNNCTSMNLSFIQFAIIFLSRQNKLLAKLTIERNSLGDIPSYLLNYVKKILKLETLLHRSLMLFRKNNSITAEKWIQSNIVKQTLNVEKQENFDEDCLVKICEDIEIDYQTLVRYFKVNEKQPIPIRKLMSLLTLKNCEKLSQYLKKTHKGVKTKVLQNTTTDPFIRPQFHDCLQRPKTIQNFSHREIKSIQKHLQRLNSQSKPSHLAAKIQNYRNHLQAQLLYFCEQLILILQLQSEIEAERIQLQLCTDFYPILIYNTLQKDREMFIIPSALQNYLQKLGMKLQLENLYCVFKRYSIRVDGRLSFNQFCQIFDLCTKEYYQIQKNREIKNIDDIDLQTIRQFLSFIKKLVKNQSKIQQIKVKMQEKISLREIFNVFDEDQDGYISMLDFKIIWKKYLLMDIKQDKLQLLWHRMKLNKQSTTMIKYQKFIYELTPRVSKTEKQKCKQKAMNITKMNSSKFIKGK